MEGPGGDDDDECGIACVACSRTDFAETLLLCDECDRGFHMQCLMPALAQVPDGDWYCAGCALSRAELRKAQSVGVPASPARSDDVDDIDAIDAHDAACAAAAGAMAGPDGTAADGTEPSLVGEMFAGYRAREAALRIDPSYMALQPTLTERMREARGRTIDTPSIFRRRPTIAVLLSR